MKVERRMEVNVEIMVLGNMETTMAVKIEKMVVVNVARGR